MTDTVGSPKKRRRDLVTVLVVACLVNFAAFLSIGVITSNNSHATNRKLAAQIARQNDADQHAALREVAAAKDLALRVAAATKLQTCVQVNKLKSGIIVYIDGVSQRTLAAARATLASPTTTAEQKRTAVRNLAGTLASAAVIRSVFKLDPSCVHQP